MKYRLAMFDFDGTICDTGPGITRCVAYALKKLGIEEQSEERLKLFVGPPLGGSFMKHYGLSAEDAERAVLYYREEYVDRGLYECSIYKGVPEMLRRLREGGVVCAVASGKPVEMIHRLIERYSLGGCFSYVSGMEGGREQKADIIKHLLSELRVTDRADAVMIGDRANDALGAAGAGVDFIACPYGGYAADGEFDSYNCVLSAEKPQQIADFILADARKDN